MRTLVDIPDKDLAALDELSRSRKVSRAQVIREAIKEHLTKSAAAGRDLDRFFGAWGPDGEDGLAYQERLRSEW
jgi:metal-responsive CopG/Arc/MetJ family transcriptional regulator